MKLIATAAALFIVAGCQQFEPTKQGNRPRKAWAEQRRVDAASSGA